MKLRAVVRGMAYNYVFAFEELNQPDSGQKQHVAQVNIALIGTMEPINYDNGLAGWRMIYDDLREIAMFSDEMPITIDINSVTQICRQEPHIPMTIISDRTLNDVANVILQSFVQITPGQGEIEFLPA